MIFERVQLSSCDLVCYVPDETAGQLKPRISVVICPGGGYSHLSPREAEPIALAFIQRGMNAFVVHYRVSPAGFPQSMQDVAEAVAWVRSHAGEHNGDPNKIALMGFSAGGHVAGSVGVRWQEPQWWSPLGLRPEDVKPNALVLCYPVISSGEYAHRGSFECLTGKQDPAAHAAHSLEHLVTRDTPPTFLWHIWEDGAVPAMNTLLFAQSLFRAGVPAEVHCYPRGGHGAALCNELTCVPGCEQWNIIPEASRWPEDAARFLRQLLDR